MGRTPKYDFKGMKVGGEPIIVDALTDYYVQSCAINWARRVANGWKFKSERVGKKIKLFRVK